MRLLHLTGSPTDAFSDDLSRLYARDCLSAADSAGVHTTLLAHVSPDGRWRFPADLGDATLAVTPAVSCGEALDHIAALGVDVMVPHMFCLPGMTHYRALFDVLGIPYIGNRPHVMAIGAQKALARAAVAAAGVDVPAGVVVARGTEPLIEPPAVVKPVDADNSLGVTFVRERGAYADAVAAAHAHGSAALVERYVPLGREVRCGIIDVDGELHLLPLEEYAVDPHRNPIRDHAAKLSRGPGGELTLMAKDPTRAWSVAGDDPICEAVGAAARRCHAALQCRHYSLFDFRIDPAGRPWFLEASLYCSYARQSVLATMARAAGIELGGLLELGLRAATGARAPDAVAT